MAQSAIAVWAENVLGGCIQPKSDGTIDFHFKVVARDTASSTNQAILIDDVVANAPVDATGTVFVTTATTAVINACSANGLTAVARSAVRLPGFMAGQ